MFAHSPLAKRFSLFLRFWRELFDTSAHLRACVLVSVRNEQSTLLFFSDCTIAMEKRHKDTKKRALDPDYGLKMGLAIGAFSLQCRSDISRCLLSTVCSAKGCRSDCQTCFGACSGENSGFMLSLSCGCGNICNLSILIWNGYSNYFALLNVSVCKTILSPDLNHCANLRTFVFNLSMFALVLLIFRRIKIYSKAYLPVS